MTPDQIIAEWKAAYAAAYPDARPREMTYKNSWYRVVYAAFPDANMRKKDVIAATNSYRDIAAAN